MVRRDKGKEYEFVERKRTYVERSAERRRLNKGKEFEFITRKNWSMGKPFGTNWRDRGM